jgi:hypothetical protein
MIFTLSALWNPRATNCTSGKNHPPPLLGVLLQRRSLVSCKESQLRPQKIELLAAISPKDLI